MKRMLLLAACAVASYAQSAADAKYFAREFIKERLKAPATAVFSRETLCAPLGKPDSDEANGTGSTPECKPVEDVGDGPDHAVYRASVDAQNASGAPLQTKFQIAVYFTNGRWSGIDAGAIVKEQYEGCVLLRQQGAKRDCEAEYPAAAKH